MIKELQANSYQRLAEEFLSVLANRDTDEDLIELGESIYRAQDAEEGRFLLASLLDVSENKVYEWILDALEEPEIESEDEDS